MSEENVAASASPERSSHRRHKKKHHHHHHRHHHHHHHRHHHRRHGQPTSLHSEERVHWFERDPPPAEQAAQENTRASHDAAAACVAAFSSIEEKKPRRTRSVELPQRGAHHHLAEEERENGAGAVALSSTEERPRKHREVQPPPLDEVKRNTPEQRTASVVEEDRDVRPLTSMEERRSTHRARSQPPPNHNGPAVEEDKAQPEVLSSVEVRAPTRKRARSAPATTEDSPRSSTVENSVVPLHSEEEVARKIKRRKHVRRKRSKSKRRALEEAERQRVAALEQGEEVQPLREEGEEVQPTHEYTEAAQPLRDQGEEVQPTHQHIEEAPVAAAAVPPSTSPPPPLRRRLGSDAPVEMGMQELGILIAPRSHMIYSRTSHIRERMAYQHELPVLEDCFARYEACSEAPSCPDEDVARRPSTSLNVRRPTTVGTEDEVPLRPSPNPCDCEVQNNMLMGFFEAHERGSAGLFSARSEVEVGDEQHVPDTKELQRQDDGHVLSGVSSCVARSTPGQPMEKSAEVEEGGDMASCASAKELVEEHGPADYPAEQDEAVGEREEEPMEAARAASTSVELMGEEEAVCAQQEPAPRQDEVPSPVMMDLAKHSHILHEPDAVLGPRDDAKADEDEVEGMHLSQMLRESPQLPPQVADEGSPATHPEEASMAHEEDVELRSNVEEGAEEHVDESLRHSPQPPEEVLPEEEQNNAAPGEEEVVMNAEDAGAVPPQTMPLEGVAGEEHVDAEPVGDALPELVATPITSPRGTPSSHDDVVVDADVGEEEHDAENDEVGFGHTLPFPTDGVQRPHVEDELPILRAWDEAPPSATSPAEPVAPPAEEREEQHDDVALTSITSTPPLQRFHTPTSFLHGQPRMIGDAIRKVMEVSDGALYRIMDRHTNTWAYFNDSAYYTMHVCFSLGKRSEVEPLGHTMMEKNTETGRVDGTMIVYPGATEPMLRGKVRGMTARYNAWDDRTLSRRGLSRSPSAQTSVLPSPRSYATSMATTPREMARMMMSDDGEGERSTSQQQQQYPARYVAPPRRLVHAPEEDVNEAEGVHQTQLSSVAAHAAPPSEAADDVSKEVCFEVESGALIHITDNATGKHSFYNASQACVMRVCFSLGRKSKVIALGRTILETDPVSGKLEGRLYVPPRSTEPFLAGHMEGQHLEYNAITL